MEIGGRFKPDGLMIYHDAVDKRSANAAYNVLETLPMSDMHMRDSQWSYSGSSGTQSPHWLKPIFSVLREHSKSPIMVTRYGSNQSTDQKTSHGVVYILGGSANLNVSNTSDVHVIPMRHNTLCVVPEGWKYWVCMTGENNARWCCL